MYVIQCTFKTVESTEYVDGLAICSDPDTPITFIYPDGKPFTGKTIWNYRLIHTKPWAHLT